jgi:serine/threonine-protein kinase
MNGEAGAVGSRTPGSRQSYGASALRDRLTESLAGRYRLVREIGRGGTSIVYLAEDLKHERYVAVKVLRPEIAAALGQDRFLREIKIAANLAHPHILPLHDSDQAGVFLYFVMPVIEGETLRERLTRGPLTIEEVVAVLRDVLGALQYAHERRVVHRDIKPENVMLTGRRALVADFGVAKALSDAATESDADTLGNAIGTPAYMAPEQASADPEVDHRADLYGVGVLAYELLTGAPPFQGDSLRAVVAAHIGEQPRLVSDRRHDIPPALTRLVMRCLEKDPARRWQSASDILSYLETAVARESILGKVAGLFTKGGLAGAVVVAAAALSVALAAGWFLRGPPPVAPTRPMIAVLPFENLGPPEDAYFADGLTDAITARLATVGSLGVISRTSTMRFRESGLPIREIAAQLSATYVLEGTVQRERPGDPTSRVRVIPQLVRAADDTHLWAEVFEQEMTGVFRLQSEIAERVASALNVALLEPERQYLAARPTEDFEAYDLYLQGHQHLERSRGSGDANARREAISLLEQATARDPLFALAWAELSEAHLWLYRYFIDPTPGRLALARAALDTALALDPELPAAHLAHGLYHYWGPDSDPDSALMEFRLVAGREPSNAQARTLVAALEAAHGNWDAALENVARAVELDPREPDWSVAAGVLHLLTRHYREAQQYFDRALELAPDDWEANASQLALELRWRADTAQARASVSRMLKRLTPGEVAVSLITTAPVLVTGGAYDSLFETMTPATIAGPLPFDYLMVRAEYFRLRGRAARAAAYYDSLATAVDAATAARGANPELMALSARAHAALGRHEAALDAAGVLEDWLAASRDALQAMELRDALVWVYALAGEPDRAVDHLEHLLAAPSFMSVPYLSVGAFPEALEQHPRFQTLRRGAALDVVARLRH